MGGDCGRVGGGDFGRGGNRFYGRFLGRVGVFRWRVVWIYRKKHFAVVHPLKRLFDSTKNKIPAGGILLGAQNKRGGYISAP